MARSQANLKLTFLRGVRGRTIEAKLLYVALLLEPTLNPCGVGAHRIAHWAKEAELKPDEAERAMTELEDSHFAYADTDTGEVLVRTLIRRDGIAEKPNMLWAACRAAKLVQSEKLRRVVADELRKLPPKPAPTVAKNGKPYHYPDPHATADEIDPPVPSDPVGEPIENDPKTDRQPSESNGSGYVPEPIENHGTGERIPIDSRTTGGGGGGSFSSSPHGTTTSRATAVLDATTTGAGVRSRNSGGGELVRAAELNATAHRPQGHAVVSEWAARQPGITSAKRRELSKAVDELLAQRADPNLIPAALDAAHGPKWHNPVKALPHAYEDVRRAAAQTRHPAQAPTRGTDATVAGWLSLKTGTHDAIDGEVVTSTPQLRALPGGQQP